MGLKKIVMKEVSTAKGVLSAQLVKEQGDGSIAHVIELMRFHATRQIPLIGVQENLKKVVTVGDVLSFLFAEFTPLSQIPARKRSAARLSRANFQTVLHCV